MMQQKHTFPGNDQFPGNLPMPKTDMVVTTLLIVRDQERSKRFYRDVLGAEVVKERDPVILRFYNTWLILNVGGGPTEDKPDVIAAPPTDSNTITTILNIRTADIQRTYEEWGARGASFLTPPMQREIETRCYLKDPDGHLIELGEAKTAFAD